MAQSDSPTITDHHRLHIDCNWSTAKCGRWAINRRRSHDNRGGPSGPLREQDRGKAKDRPVPRISP